MLWYTTYRSFNCSTYLHSYHILHKYIYSLKWLWTCVQLDNLIAMYLKYTTSSIHQNKLGNQISRYLTAFLKIHINKRILYLYITYKDKKNFFLLTFSSQYIKKQKKLSIASGNDTSCRYICIFISSSSIHKKEEEKKKKKEWEVFENGKTPK